MPTEQLSKHAEDVRRIIRAIEAARTELELAILKEPTSYPREELTAANIHIMAAVQHLKEIC